MNGTLAKNSDARIRAYVVWVPKLRGKEGDVAEASATFPDARARHFWDGDGLTLRAFSPVLGLPPDQDAWDVYLIYGPSARWDGPLPPTPDFWMHQLGGIDIGTRLDPVVFGNRLADVLASSKR